MPTFAESVNKFNSDWQVTREAAKKIKDPRPKLDLVAKFLKENPSKANFARVLNWTRMTKLGYSSNPSIQELFNDMLAWMDANIDTFDKEDSDTDLNDLPADKFVAVYKDLVNRKNNFQHGGKRPKTMTEYLEKMKQVAHTRKISLPIDPMA